MTALRIKKVLLEKGADSSLFASKILKRLSGLPFYEICPPCVTVSQSPLQQKQVLHLSSHPGEFIKKCPGTKGYICCNYKILNVGANCPMNCSYCVLQAYLNQPYLRIYTNLEEKLDLLREHLDGNADMIFRIGTGEYTDSLALDPIAGWTDLLLPFFAARKNAVLELKTKSIHIERLLACEIRKRIIVSWSLNSPHVASLEEHGAPGIRERIEAARQCQKEGFTIGFHFDPLVYHPGWKEGYLRTIELMAERLDPNGVIWVSLGCMRYLPELKPVIRSRHPGSRVLNGEFIRGLDGKMRLFKPIRIEMYGFMSEKLALWRNDPGLYLCMESPDVWQSALGWNPEDSSGLSRYLDQRVRDFIPFK